LVVLVSSLPGFLAHRQALEDFFVFEPLNPLRTGMEVKPQGPLYYYLPVAEVGRTENFRVLGFLQLLVDAGYFFNLLRRDLCD
jgi:hypothetical protein